VFFSGKTVSGHIIRFFTKAQYSHVGIVWRFPELPNRLFVSEASTNLARLADIETSSVKRGVELLDFRCKIFCGYYDRVAIRRLEHERSPEFLTAIEEFRKAMRNVSYEKDRVQFVKVMPSAG
jgi:hypothetical protein